MIPPTIAQDCQSPGEREIYRRLSQARDTDDWIVLHSLDIAHHREQLSGEVDFVVLVPHMGALCLEVKACTSLSRQHGQWFYGHDISGDPRGPFRQAADAMHSMRARVARRVPALRALPFCSAVVFPYLRFAVVSDEWHSWQVIDKASLNARPLPTLIQAVLVKARKHFSSSPSARWFHDHLGEPTIDQCRQLAHVLRPDFEFFESPRSRAKRQTEELRRYTQEQFSALDALEANPRVMFTGPAGTGKTLLAIEAARRAVGDGRRVLFLCFNRLLHGWLLEQLAGIFEHITCRTIHAHFCSLAGLTPPRTPPPTFWRTDLPAATLDRLRDSKPEGALFDALIIDEAQDLFYPPYLDALALCLDGGLDGGYWRIFGDFEQQAIYDETVLDPGAFLRDRAGPVAHFALRTNCRNTPRVASFVRLLAGLNPDYSGVLRIDDGIEPQIHYYAKPSQQRALLVEAVRTLHDAGYKGSDIVVLSPKRDDVCVAAQVSHESAIPCLRPISVAGRNDVSYCTVHAFKGLEAPAIVVTDVEHLDSAHFNRLFYVAATRSLSRLAVLAHETTKEDIIRMFV